MVLNRIKYFSALILFFVLGIVGCKKHTSEPPPDKLTLLKQQVTGEWELTKGVYIEYDDTGKVSYSQNLPNESPLPWYDLRKADKLYIADRHGREELGYSLTISNDGISRIKIEASSWDISRTYDITTISANAMTWVIDQRNPDAGPGFLSRVYTEYNFTKR